MRRIALMSLAWRHRHRLLRWIPFVIGAVPRALAGDRSSLLTELRLLASLEQDGGFPHVRIDVTGRTAHFSGLVFSNDDVAALEDIAARLGLDASVKGLRVRRRSGSRPAGSLISTSG